MHKVKGSLTSNSCKGCCLQKGMQLVIACPEASAHLLYALVTRWCKLCELNLPNNMKEANDFNITDLTIQVNKQLNQSHNFILYSWSTALTIIKVYKH